MLAPRDLEMLAAIGGRHVTLTKTTTMTLAYQVRVTARLRPDLLNVGDLMARGWSLIPLKPRTKVPASEVGGIPTPSPPHSTSSSSGSPLPAATWAS